MGYTRLQLLSAAVTRLGLGDDLFDLDTENITDIAAALDAMISDWRNDGIAIPFPLNSNPDSIDLTQDTNIPLVYIRAVVFNLAVEISPILNEQVPHKAQTIADSTYDKILRRAEENEREPFQYPEGTVAGAGNKPWRYNEDPFMNDPVLDDLPDLDF